MQSIYFLGNIVEFATMFSKPNQQRPLNKNPTKLNKVCLQLFGAKFSLSISYNFVPNMDNHVCKVHIPTELPFCLLPLLVGKVYCTRYNR